MHGQSVGNRDSIVLTIGKLQQFGFYVININPLGSRSHTTFHIYPWAIFSETVPYMITCTSPVINK